MTELTMRPLDFEEFSWSVGVQPAIWDEVRSACAARVPLDGPIHEKLMAD